MMSDKEVSFRYEGYNFKWWTLETLAGIYVIFFCSARAESTPYGAVYINRIFWQKNKIFKTHLNKVELFGCYWPNMYDLYNFFFVCRKATPLWIGIIHPEGTTHPPGVIRIKVIPGKYIYGSIDNVQVSMSKCRIFFRTIFYFIKYNIPYST